MKIFEVKHKVMKISEVKHKISKRNIKALLALALQYKKITIKQLENQKQPKLTYRLSARLTKITGFNQHCDVCITVASNCSKCFWAYKAVYKYDTQMCSDQSSYLNIYNSNTIKSLHENMNKRGDYILRQLKKAGCIWYNETTGRWRLSPLVMNNGIK